MIESLCLITLVAINQIYFMSNNRNQLHHTHENNQNDQWQENGWMMDVLEERVDDGRVRRTGG